MRIDPRTYTFNSQPRFEDVPRLQAAQEFGRMIVEKSVEVSAECWRIAKGHDEQAVILMTHWHLTELLDAAVVLVGAGAIEPARLQLRAALESLVTLEYILQADTKRRAYAWLLVNDILGRITTWTKLDKSTENGKRFEQLAAAEGHAFPAPEDALAKAARLQEMLEKNPLWTEAYQEYLRLKDTKFKKAHNRPAWHEMFGGPEGGGLPPIAKHVGRGTEYELLYRFWSRRVHGTDAVQRFKKEGVQPLRDTSELDMTVNMTANFGLAAIRKLSGYYIPERLQEYGRWYVERVRPVWARFGPSPEIEAAVRAAATGPAIEPDSRRSETR